MANLQNFLIPQGEIQTKVTEKSVEIAELFGKYLAKKDQIPGKNGRYKDVEPLTTSQLRKFFGEVKRQQMQGYDETNFVMLKPKLAYAVGRAKSGNSNKEYKIKDFYDVLANAIDTVQTSPDKDKAFKNFITIFEAIVAYHKANEEK